MTYERPPSSGRFASRALVPRDIDPRSALPNDNGAGPNVPAQSVGPTSSEGIGNTNVMYPVGAPPAQPWSGWPVGWSPPPAGNDWSGTGYGRQGAQANLSTAVTCIDLNSRELASLPVYGMRGESPFTLPAWSDNPEPERYASWAELMLEAVNSLLSRGECFLYVTGRFHDGYPSRFVVLPADVVEVTTTSAGTRRFAVNGSEIERRDICFTRYQCIAGRDRGISPLEWIGSSLLTSGALERYASDLAARGGVPWAALSVPGYLSDDQAKEGRDRWLAARWDSHGAPAMLSNGATLQTLALSPRDMALLELREFDERRVCGAFGVPSFLVNVSQATGLTYANATALFDHHWRATLRPLANLIASAWSAFLLPRGQRIEFNPDRYVQPALGERVAAWMTMHNIVDADGTRAMDVPEIRSAERLGPATPPSSPPLPPPPAEADAQLLTGAAL